jgi:hypothetical protein
MSCSVHEVVIHCCDEVEQFLLEYLDAMEQLAEHDVVLKMQPVSCAHFFDLCRVVLGITVALCVFLQEVWLLEMEVTLLHQVLRIFDVDQEFEDAVVLPMNSLLINNNLDRPLAIV